MCIVQIQSVWVNFACTRRLFNLLAEAIINARNACLRVKCAIFLLKIKQIPSSYRLVLGFTFLKRIQNQFIGDVYCPVEYCLNREKCISIGGYVTTPRSIYGCDNCGASLFVHKVPFRLQEHVKTTKTDKTRFFFAKKRWTCYTTNNCSIKSHFNYPKIVRKNWVWTTSRLLEMCIVRHVETKSVFIFQPTKRLVSTTVKSVKPATVFWIFLLRTKNQPLCCLSVIEHIVYTSRDYEKPSPFFKKFRRQSQPGTSEP